MSSPADLTWRLLKVVSGGQTGVDRGALEAAIEAGIEHGGWCPRGRLAEDGPIPAKFRLRETESPLYHIRTERNVIDSDGTLILHFGPLTGGTLLTRRLARAHSRPLLEIDLQQPSSPWGACSWLRSHRIGVVNVAGPRESSQTGIQDAARAWLGKLLAVVQGCN
jgi:hypothetical protein